MPQWETIRTTILFFSGLAGIAFQTLHGPVEPELLVVFASMLGLPIFLKEKKKGDD